MMTPGTNTSLIHGRVWPRVHSGFVQEDYLSTFQDRDVIDDFLIENWHKIKGFYMTDIFRSRLLLRQLHASLGLEGDVIECGTYRGAIGILMGLLIKAHGSSKKVFMLDTFEGLPAPERSNEQRDIADFRRGYVPGTMKASLSALQKRIASHDLTDVCVPVKGLFAESFERFSKSQQYCFAYLDGDLYDSTKTCLGYLSARMKDGSVIVLDDYYDGVGGVAFAVHEYLRETSEIVFIGPPPQAFIRRGETTANTTSEYSTVETEKHRVPMSIAEIKQDVVFQKYLDDVFEVYSTRYSLLKEYRKICKEGFDGLERQSFHQGRFPVAPEGQQWRNEGYHHQPIDWPRYAAMLEDDTK